MKKIMKKLLSKNTIIIVPNSSKNTKQFTIYNSLFIILLITSVSFFSFILFENNFLSKENVSLHKEIKEKKKIISIVEKNNAYFEKHASNQELQIVTLKNELETQKENYKEKLSKLSILEQEIVTLVNTFNSQNDFDINFTASRSLSIPRESKQADDTVNFKDLIDIDIKNYAELIQKIENRIDFLESKPDLIPLDNKITDDFGYRIHPITGKFDKHNGVDISADIGDDIKAAGAGIVTFSGWNGTYGRVLIISHGYGYKTIYAHNNQLLKEVGEEIKKGEVIAKAGNSGRSTGPHLHFEIHKDNKIIDPKTLIDFN